MKALTAKQKTVLEFIGRYSLDRGFPPTLWEIGKGISLANISAVGGQLVALEKKGYAAATDLGELDDMVQRLLEESTSKD